MSVNPFDIRTVLLAKHAQHVVLIHFPIALFTAAVAFDYLTQWTNNRTLAAAAYFNLLLAAVSTVPVVATGLAAWQWALEGQKLTETRTDTGNTSGLACAGLPIQLVHSTWIRLRRGLSCSWRNG
jgi:uncharacterized membrane protein